MIDHSPEPQRDARLGALLRGTLGDVPHDAVHWDALARRISARLGQPISVPWWSYAARWERRAIPLALAAGIAGAVTLWSASSSARSVQTAALSDVLSVVMSGTPASDAALQVAQSMTSTVELTDGAPE